MFRLLILFIILSPLSLIHANQLDSTINEFFTKSVDVFGIPIIATDKVKNKNLQEAQKVLNQWLDNDSDGSPDNPLVVQSLIKSQARIVMGASESDFENAFDEMIEVAEDAGLDPEDFEPQMIGLIANEPKIAYLEEILHLVTQWGYAPAYPNIFGEESGSELALAMDKSRGGFFEDVPNKYPNSSWYHYDDQECEYNCMVTEYIYWALTSLLGAQKNRLSDIQDEWELNTPEKMQKDQGFMKIYNNEEYALPKKLPQI